jgi:ubiquinone/menaquinone biosynthesis C-methylase UbiE
MNGHQRLVNLIFYDPIFSTIDFDTVLDVGAGNGKMVDYFSQRGKKATGMDLHPSRKDIQKVDIFKNKIPDNSYDLVYSAHVIEHLSEAEKFAKELVRISNRYVCIMAPLPGKKFWDQPDHLRPYTKEALKRVFHLNKWIRAFEINVPFFEPVAFILFEKKDSRLVGNKKD